MVAKGVEAEPHVSPQIRVGRRPCNKAQRPQKHREPYQQHGIPSREAL
jgi:hypothetical protein